MDVLGLPQDAGAQAKQEGPGSAFPAGRLDGSSAAPEELLKTLWGKLYVQ